ncbi:MAG: N-acetylmuramoyl-L-alanine amidase [Pseudomonadota bacterium]|nr:N-acetylmuramoyl-L-alanine amidase [Pseudomonadota bacterium]
MATNYRRWRTIAGAGLIALCGAALLALGVTRGRAVARDDSGNALFSEARDGSVTLALAPAVTDVTVHGPAGRPIVVLDAGHGGRDPGATAVSGAVTEKQLTLALVEELRDLLIERGRLRVALTRDGDTYLTLDQRAAIARRLGASLYLSVHMDSAPNPLARGASVYSLSDVASDSDAARFARVENGAAEASSADAGSAEAILSDLALRDQMGASADLAQRMVRKAAGRVLLRPEPHRFADFHVLRRAAVPAVLFEAGYISNAEDELTLTSPEQRAKIVTALAQTIEADVAARRNR